jgi:hypothetical protein
VGIPDKLNVPAGQAVQKEEPATRTYILLRRKIPPSGYRSRIVNLKVFGALVTTEKFFNLVKPQEKLFYSFYPHLLQL